MTYQTDLKGVADNEIYGRAVAFTDGRPGIISGGTAAYAWVRSLDGRTAHQYSIATIKERIIKGHMTFPIS